MFNQEKKNVFAKIEKLIKECKKLKIDNIYFLKKQTNPTLNEKLFLLEYCLNDIKKIIKNPKNFEHYSLSSIQ
ncbi:MAG TPA: hypothetical protein PKY81_10460 [bacterium]|nr:hypothetical protein [bacterium]